MTARRVADRRLDAAGSPDRDVVGTRMERHRRAPLSSTISMSPLQVFAAAFMLLVAAAVAVALGQFTASYRAPWISVGFSAGAVACTFISVRKRPRS